MILEFTFQRYNNFGISSVIMMDMFLLPSRNVPNENSAPLRVTFDSVSNEGLDTAHL